MICYCMHALSCHVMCCSIVFVVFVLLRFVVVRLVCCYLCVIVVLRVVAWCGVVCFISFMCVSGDLFVSLRDCCVCCVDVC